MIAVRTTSLTVPPSAVRTALNSSNLPSVQAHRRCGPIGPFSDRAVGVIACFASEGTVEARVLPDAATLLAAFTALLTVGIDEACWSGWVTASEKAPLTSDRDDGGRRGVQSFGASCFASGSRSNISCMRSVPATPSTMQWWTLEMSAHLSSARPSTSQSSHSGLAMSRRWPSTRPARLRSCSSLPGRGTAVCRTWYRIWKCGSSTHRGRPSCIGTGRTRWRYRGTFGSLLRISRTTSP